MRAMKIDEIEGAVVTFPFMSAGKYMRNGEWMSGAELAKMPISNRNSLQDKGYLYPIPKSALPHLSLGKEAAKDEPQPQPPVAAASERFVINRGFGRFDVIEGRTVNASPLGKEAAHALAGIPMDAKKTA
jgi:hypothetical protein